MDFTAAQNEAITYDCNNLQIIACAGSGKTEVVANRVVHLLSPEKGGLLPRNIIAFTYNDKAAAELKDRIITRCHEKYGEMTGLAEMFIGTIHAFCLDLLKTEIPEYLKFDVLEEVQQSLFVDRHSASSGLTRSTDLSGNRLRRYRDTFHYINALTILREADINADVLQGNTVVDGLESYRTLLYEKRYLDFSEQLAAALEALTCDEDMMARLAERIRYVIVDEYQDVNPIQEAIIWALHDLGAKLCVVGDDDQTIYQWRGSDVQNILTFADRYPDVKYIALERNFRSSPGIVETARPFIEQNTDRLSKTMKAGGIQPYEKGDIVALSFASPNEEADYIAQTIRSLRGVAILEEKDGKVIERGISWSDMAVLLRSVKHNGEPIIDALDAAGIPFVVIGMTNLFSAAEAEAARQLFYFMADRPGVDEASLERYWTNAQLGIAAGDLRKAIEYVVESKASLRGPEEKRWGLYSIQRVFLKFLEIARIREESVPNGEGEVVFYNFGKFSQLISDFEAIHFRSKPVEKYRTFADFLQHRAEDSYPEGWQDNQYANPDAVRVTTIHKAKGMQWPVVFVPALIRNRFPSMAHGGRSVWHLLPAAGIVGQERFVGDTDNPEDERRLFYVAMTRSKKFLHMTWAPVPGNQLYQRASNFYENILGSKCVVRRPQDYTTRKHLEPQPRKGIANVSFSFSDLKYYFECPYQFKLRILYGFNAPIDEALGYGKSLHDALAEVHARAIRGDITKREEIPRLIETHLHTPFAYPALQRKLKESAENVLDNYLVDNHDIFDKLEFSEKTIEITCGDGVTVNGRIDLVRRLDTDEITIIDLKSNDRAQAENVTETQLQIYALGYQELTGNDADYVEIYELSERRRKPRSVDPEYIGEIKARIQVAAEALRQGNLPPAPDGNRCKECEYPGMCTACARPPNRKT